MKLFGYPGNQDAERSFPEAFQSQAFAREPSATVEKMWSECQRCELRTVCFWTFLDLIFGLFAMFFISRCLHLHLQFKMFFQLKMSVFQFALYFTALLKAVGMGQMSR